MLRKSLSLLALMLLSLPVFAQEIETGTNGYVRCPAGQQNVYLYQNVDNFEMLARLKCGDKVSVTGKQDTFNGYLKVRTANGNEGFLPKDQVTSTAPEDARTAVAIERPLPVSAGQGTSLPIPQVGGEPLDLPRTELFGGYSYLSMDTGSASRTSFPLGWHASGTYNLNRWFGIEADVSGHYKNACGGVSTVSCGNLVFMGGPRVSYRTGNLIVFGHGLFGLGNLRASQLGLPASETKFAWAPGAGVEFVWTNRISLRVGQLDYLMTRYTEPGVTQQQNFRVSAGVVFRLGRVVIE